MIYRYDESHEIMIRIPLLKNNIQKDFIDGEDELPAAEQWELPNR